MNFNIATIISTLGASAFIVANFFQIKRILKTKSSNDVSIPFLCLCLFGVLCVLILVYITDNHWLTRFQQWTNFVGLLSTLIVTIYYRIYNDRCDTWHSYRERVYFKK